jgi:glutamate dehydrogenase (NAD(P)+)
MEAAKQLNMTLDDTTKVAIQGFGNVGSHAALKFAKIGCKVTHISDISGGYTNRNGIDLQKATEYVQKNRSLKGFTEADSISQEDVLTAPVDIVVPAATGHVINEKVAQKLKCKILAEGANGPTTTEGDKVLKERQKEILLVPDVLANAGGVTVSYFEWVQGLQNFFWSAKEINRELAKLMTNAFEEVATTQRKHNVYMRVAAQMVGIERVTRAMLARGLYP